MGHERTLYWDGCFNARDLGLFETASGRMTRPGRLIRADQLGRLTPEGKAAAYEGGVRTVIDLRSPKEVSEEPSAVWDRPDVEVLNIPIERYEAHVGQKIMQAGSRAEVYCIVLDHYPEEIAKICRAILNAKPGAVVFHCHSGKDRTGMVAALLLKNAGVPDGPVIADYAESQVNLEPYYAAEQKADPDAKVDTTSFWNRPTATAEMMRLMLDHLDTSYGGVSTYLRSTGLSQDELDQLREILIPPDLEEA